LVEVNNYVDVEDAMIRIKVELVKGTALTENLLVTSYRKSYLYGDWPKVKKVVDIHEFLLDILDFTGGLTREQLVKFTNIPRTPLYDTLKRLMSEGKVTAMHLHDSKYRGRPKTVVHK